MLFIGINDFKSVNNSLGPIWGDILLALFDQRFVNNLNDTDFIERHGGDEFIILFKNTTSKEEVIVFCEKIIRLISSPFRLEQETIYVSLNIGIVSYPDVMAQT